MTFFISKNRQHNFATLHVTLHLPYQVPLCFFLSSIQANIIGTTTRLEMVQVIIPPTVGAAIGFINSEPAPVLSMIGRRARMVVAVVITMGLTLSNEAWMTLLFTSPPLLTQLLHIFNNNNAIFNRYSKEGNVTNPNSS